MLSGVNWNRSAWRQGTGRDGLWNAYQGFSVVGIQLASPSIWSPKHVCSASVIGVLWAHTSLLVGGHALVLWGHMYPGPSQLAVGTRSPLARGFPGNWIRQNSSRLIKIQ